MDPFIKGGIFMQEEINMQKAQIVKILFLCIIVELAFNNH